MCAKTLISLQLLNINGICIEASTTRRALLSEDETTILSITVKTVEIRQKKSQNRGVESPKLSGFVPVSSVKVSRFNNYNSLSTIAETLAKQVFPD